ncbi:MAG TPA: hypothetical protein VGH49_05465, partial [Xanthobacteraceae bacterium]
MMAQTPRLIGYSAHNAINSPVHSIPLLRDSIHNTMQDGGTTVGGTTVRIKLAAIFVGALLLAGCAAGGPQFRAEANKPAAGRALLYIYRPHTLIGIANPDVSIVHLDGRRLTRIRIGGSLAVPVSPGQHTLTATQSMLGN